MAAWLHIIVAICFVLTFIIAASSSAPSIRELYASSRRPKRRASRLKTVTEEPMSIAKESSNGVIEPLSIEEKSNEHKSNEVNEHKSFEEYAPIPIPRELETIVSLPSPASQFWTQSSKSPMTTLTESKTTELDEDQILCKRTSMDSNPNSTVAMAYCVEIQSRLQHLESLLIDDSQRIDTDSYLIDKNEDNAAESNVSMLDGLHSANLHILESIIERVVDEKSRSDPAHKDRDRHFYSKLYESSSGSSKSNEWSQSLGRKRRPSVEEVAYRHLDRTARALWEDALRMVQSVDSMKMEAGSDISSVIISAIMLYCGGALYFSATQNTSISILSFIFGAILIIMVMAIGVLFDKSTTSRDWSLFMIATTLSVVVLYLALGVVASSVNVTSAVLLIFAVLMANQYSLAPIMAKRRCNEIWICVLFNCGLLLFSYFMQCPEMQFMQNMSSLSTDPEIVISEVSTQADVIDSMPTVEAPATVDSTTLSPDSVTMSTTFEIMEQWLFYIMSLVYNVVSLVLTDFWSMLDITYALDAEEVAQKIQVEVAQRIQDGMDGQTLIGLQQRAQEMMGAGFDSVSSTVAEAVTARLNQMSDVVTEGVSDAMSTDGVASTFMTDEGSTADTLYWFNKIFFLFPVPLFHAVIVSWFITHATLLMRSFSTYKAATIKMLYCSEIALAYVLAVVFWSMSQFDNTLFILMAVASPWTIGLLKAIWEGDLGTDMSRHVTMFNLWFFVALFLSILWNWIAHTGLFWALFSPNILVVAVPIILTMHSIPMMIDEVVWATDF